MNMPDRIERGLWPHPPLKFEDVVRHLTRVLESEQWFPCEWKPDRVGEMGVIERRPWSYVYRCQRFHPTNPSVRADYMETAFETADEAARHYLKSNFNLPGDLDGWKVIGNGRRRRLLNTIAAIVRWLTGNDVGAAK